MSSIIPGFDYDIFISYRQKDNKYDGWVTEFVDKLKGELESTFKEDISIYFDANPKDGLLETHIVDESLAKKLKCLIFIPILSQTYCDSKSFAWQQEFCVFNKLAKEDPFGRDIRLTGGNVASRILPVKIHELDPEDKTLLENELGGVLRCIEFIYKSAGVNRPLNPSDNPDKNLNKTYYRDQINKVANAVKEITAAIKKHNQQYEEVSKVAINTKNEPPKNLKTKIIVGSLIILALIVAVYFLIPKLSVSSETINKSVAVLPFTNLSNDPEQEYFSEGIVEAILNHLFKVGELKVISSTSTKRYKNTELPLKRIAKELGVSSILEGSVQRIGNNVRITAQLIDAKTDVHLWSEIYDRTISDIFSIQTEVAQNIARELNATLTSEEKEQIEKNQTNNPEAYNLYLQGRFFINKRVKEGFNKSVEYFEKAVDVDPDYALAYAGLADAYFLLSWYNLMPKTEGYTRSKEYALKAISIDKNLAEAHTILGTLLCWNERKWEEARNELQLAVELNPNFVTAHSYYSELLDILRETGEARKQINIALILDPFFPTMHILSAMYYFNEGKLKESLTEYLKVQELDSNYITLNWRFFNIYIRQGEDFKAMKELQRIIIKDTSTIKYEQIVEEIYNKLGINGLLNWLIELELKNPEPLPMSLATWYAMLGEKEEALVWLEKALEKNSSELPRININPNFDNMRSEPRFQTIIKKMGLSKYQDRKK